MIGLIQKTPRYQHRGTAASKERGIHLQHPSSIKGLHNIILGKVLPQFDSHLHASTNAEEEYSSAEEATTNSSSSAKEATTSSSSSAEEATTSSSSSNRGFLAKSASIYLASTILLAKLGFLGEGYTDALIVQDTGVALLTTVLALIFVKVVTKLAADGVLKPRDSRKIIHILSAPLFMVCWPLFSDVWGARLFASFVPALQGLKLYVASTSSSDGESNELANAISRSGDKEEVLGGPFIYVIILFSAIMLSFRDNLSGVVALCTMAAGDGMADIVGRRLGKTNKWSFSDTKSIAGTLGFTVSAALCSILLTSWLMYTNAIVGAVLPMGALIFRIILISIVSALVELLPVGDDNWSVPITAGVLSSILIY